MNYSIIKDEKLFREFIDSLPDLLPNEKFYVCLFSRSKYCKGLAHIKSDKSQMRRLVVGKDFLYDKVKQMECEIGSYKQRHTTVPQEALALYITINPRDLLKATKNSLLKFASLIGVDYNGYDPQQEVISEIHRACSRKIFLDFDFDDIDFETVKDEMFSYINKDACKVLKTRGGFHLIIERDKIASEIRNTFYNKISAMKGCDIKGDTMIPVPGCTQGNFIPHFLNLE